MIIFWQNWRSLHNGHQLSCFVNREKPLAMYIFAKDRAVAQKFLDNTSSGGFVFNDTMMHAGCKFCQHAQLVLLSKQTA